MGSTKIATVTSSEVRYYFQDHLGSTNVVTNSAGSQIELVEYKPFGEFAKRVQTGTSNAAWYYFTGKPLDDETGLMFYGARYYSPLLGRFITPDTVVQSPMNPQTLNRYSYCGNNPVSFTDPDGHWFWFAVAIIAGGVSGGVSAYQSGGNVLAGVFLGAATTAITGGVGAWVGTAVKAGTMSIQMGMATMAAVGATTSAVNAAITGQNVGFNALMGGLSVGVGFGSAAAFTSNFTKNAFSGGLAAALFSGAVVNATGAAITGGNIGQAALMGGVQNGAYFVAGYGAAKAYSKFQQTRANVAASQARLTVGEAETVVQQQALSEDLGPRTVKLNPDVFPQSANEMDSYLGLNGTRIQDTVSTPGRGKVVWNPSDNVKITFEKHPYHVNAPDYHKGSHWHVDTPAASHQRFLPGDKIPGKTYSIGGGNE